jgi:hypothetical protein
VTFGVISNCPGGRLWEYQFDISPPRLLQPGTHWVSVYGTVETGSTGESYQVSAGEGAVQSNPYRVRQAPFGVWLDGGPYHGDISRDLALDIDGVCANDSDGDGVADSLDNCPYEPNPTQSDLGGLGAAPPDGIGDACQCGDVNNNGTVTSSDVTVLKRALLNLNPAFSVGGNAACTAAGVPAACCSGVGTGSCNPGLGAAGLSKCNVAATPTPGVAGCTSSDATVISRALLSLSPGIAQGCDAAQP